MTKDKLQDYECDCQMELPFDFVPPDYNPDVYMGSTHQQLHEYDFEVAAGYGYYDDEGCFHWTRRPE